MIRLNFVIIFFNAACFVYGLLIFSGAFVVLFPDLSLPFKYSIECIL
jgi:hypothetical protein